MDSHSVRTEHAAEAVTVGGIVFDNNLYDARGDVLYLHVGDPNEAVDFDGTAEGDATRYGPDGSLVGITIVDAKRRLEADGGIELTLPEHRVKVADLGRILA